MTVVGCRLDLCTRTTAADEVIRRWADGAPWATVVASQAPPQVFGLGAAWWTVTGPLGTGDLLAALCHEVDTVENA